MRRWLRSARTSRSAVLFVMSWAKAWRRSKRISQKKLWLKLKDNNCKSLERANKEGTPSVFLSLHIKQNQFHHGPWIQRYTEFDRRKTSVNQPEFKRVVLKLSGEA